MPPGSSSSGGFRESVKRRARRVKKWFESEDQAPAPRIPSPQPQPQRLAGTLPPQLPTILTAPPQLPTRPQQSELLPQPVPSGGISISTSTANLVTPDDAQLANAESTLAQGAKKAGADAWTGLKVALGLVKESSDAFPPLKSAVAGFLGVVDIFEKAAQNRKDYEALALHLESMVTEFREHPEERTSAGMSEALKAMSSALDTQLEHVIEQRQRTGFRSHLEAGQDVSDVQECHRRVETLCRELQNKAALKTWSIVEEQEARGRLTQLNAALQAMYDSSLSDVVGRRTCTPGTRQAILAGMRKWADDPESPKVYWLNGMAGTGKTTLAYSFCAEMQSAHRLGASFFCSRADADSRDVSKIVPTIAHQLANLLPTYYKVLVRRIGEDKVIGARRTETQFEKLIRDPLREIQTSVPEGIVVTIDALDECERRDGAQDILNALLLYARDLPIKFFITCRPEPGLFDVLQAEGEHQRAALDLHDIEASFVKADIKTYLQDELGAISLPHDKLGRLAEQAGTLFIYAATAVRYIHPKSRRVNFHQRLDDLLSVTSETGSEKYKGIDKLYKAVLAAPFADEDLGVREKENIRLVLDTALCVREPMSIITTAKLLELEEEDVICALQHLRSVLHVSQGANLISTLHASFPDFMLDVDRSKDLCCNAARNHQHLSLRCFSAMHRLLRFNICELESSFILDENVQDLAKNIDERISSELFYSSRYWGDHLVSATARDDVQLALQEFLSYRLLFWMEVLNLRNCIRVGASTLAHVHAWLQKSGGSNDLLELALDAGRFVTAFGMSPASRSTPHIYISALTFWPETRPVRRRYWKRTQGLMSLEGPAMKQRDLSCLATWNTASAVHCTAFSPDGARIVSGSDDKAICVWDARSGDLVAGPFKGHTSRVTSVGFSSDGHRIVSGSTDLTIRVWNAHSGALVAGPFQGHGDAVTSVGFSPDGTRIVSGSWDSTIRVWDARSGDLVAGPFKGHSEGVVYVGFSPDGALVISVSDDKTIRVWDACSGALVAGPFERTGAVKSVAFSPDGTLIVSGSDDKIIRVWDVSSGNLVTMLHGHTDWVWSVGFSPDSTRIVSGSRDNTIRVWDTRSQTLVAGPFEGHTGSVKSVAFSPDGTIIVSGSDDETIRVWDAYSRALVAGPLEGHTDWVQSVGFSPDSTRIVSGSDDHTIHVWDAHTGALVAGPFRGHTGAVISVGFSPDGTRIVSGSRDRTIRVWDACSCALVAGPFKGHTTEVSSVSFSPDGGRIVSGSWDKSICIWDARSGDIMVGPLERHTGAVKSVAFSPDGTHIVSGSWDKTIYVWDARNGALVAGPFKGHTMEVSSVGFSPDGTCIVSGSDDHTVRVWDVRSRALVAGPFQGHTDSIWSVGFSPDGTRIASGSRDRTIRVWDARSGALVAGPFEGHTGAVKSVGFSSDGTRIISGSRDKTIRAWDVPLQPRDSEVLVDWVMDNKGMVRTSQGQLLLCVPADLWTGLMRPYNTVCIYCKGTLKLDFRGILLGNDWLGCYQLK